MALWMEKTLKNVINQILILLNKIKRRKTITITNTKVSKEKNSKGKRFYRVLL